MFYLKGILVQLYGLWGLGACVCGLVLGWFLLFFFFQLLNAPFLGADQFPQGPV